MNDSITPLEQDQKSSDEEEVKKEHSMWEISQTDNSISRSSSIKLGEQAAFHLQWKVSNKEVNKQSPPKKSIFGRRTARAPIGPNLVDNSTKPDANQQTVSPERKRDNLFSSQKVTRRMVSTMFVNQQAAQSSKFASGCPSLCSGDSSSISQTLDSEKYDMKSLMFDDAVSAIGSRKKKHPAVMESQSLESDDPEEVREDYKNEIMAEIPPWEKIRRRLTISQASQFYQVWKLVEILFSFGTALIYCYEATFLHLQTDQQKAFFEEADTIFEIFFLLSLLIQVLLDEHHHSEGLWELKASLLKLVKQQKFIINVVTLVPFPQLVSPFFSPLFCQRLHIVKSLRLKYGLGFLDYKMLKKSLHQVQIHRLQAKLRNPDFEEDPQQDSAQMTAIMLTTEVLKTLRLVVIIVFLSFFTGSLWFIFSEYIHGFDRWSADNFLSAFGLDGDLNSGPSTKLTYFAFTTVSTVGLGDFHPRNSPERILCSIVMLFGVMCTTMLMDNFSMMIKRLQDFGKPYDESKQFSLFVGTLQKFNEGQHLPRNLQHRMEQYFHYRWSFNRNLAISTEEDVGLYDELPGRLKTELYVDFLFKGFIDKYRVVLDLGQSHFPYKRKYLREVRDKQADISQIDWTRYYTDYTHDDFLVSLLRELEPIKFNYGKLLLRQGQDPVTEVYFPMRGELQFGYNHQKFLQNIDLDELTIPFDPNSRTYQEVRGRITQNLKQQAAECKTIHKRFQYPIALGPSQAVGLFETIFEKPAQFSIRIVRNEEDSFEDKDKIADCYFIRQSSWRRILNADDDDEKKARLIERFRTNALTTFIRRVYQPIREHRQCFVQRENMMIFKDYDKHRLKNEELYNEIAKPLVEAPLKKLKQEGSKRKIFENRQRTLIMTQGIHMIARQNTHRPSLKAEEGTFESLEEIADMIEKSTLDLCHKPFKQISLLNLKREDDVKNEPPISEVQMTLARKVLDAASELQVLAANLRLMKKFLEITRFSIQNSSSKDTLSDDDTIPQLKTEIAQLKEQLQQEKDCNHELMVKLNGEIAQKQKIRKLGSMFSFQDNPNPPRIGQSRNDTKTQNWSSSQKKESQSSGSSDSVVSPPIQVQALNPPKLPRKSQFSLMKTQTLKSEVSGNSTQILQQPYNINASSKRPVLEIDLMSALTQAGFKVPRLSLKDDSFLLLPKTTIISDTPLQPPKIKAERSQSVSPNHRGLLPKADMLNEGRKTIKGSQLKPPELPSDLMFKLRESRDVILPRIRETGTFNTFSFDDSQKKAQEEVAKEQTPQPPKEEEPEAEVAKADEEAQEEQPVYDRRIRKKKKVISEFTRIPSPIQEARNDEEYSPNPGLHQKQATQGSCFDLKSCGPSSEQQSAVESQVGVSQFYNMMDEQSSDSTCLDLADIKAGVVSEKETATNIDKSSQALQEESPNICKIPNLKKLTEAHQCRISSDEPNQASPMAGSLLHRLKKAD